VAFIRRTQAAAKRVVVTRTLLLLLLLLEAPRTRLVMRREDEEALLDRARHAKAPTPNKKSPVTKQGGGVRESVSVNGCEMKGANEGKSKVRLQQATSPPPQCPPLFLYFEHQFVDHTHIQTHTQSQGREHASGPSKGLGSIAPLLLLLPLS